MTKIHAMLAALFGVLALLVLGATAAVDTRLRHHLAVV